MRSTEAVTKEKSARTPDLTNHKAPEKLEVHQAWPEQESISGSIHSTFDE